MAKIPFGVRLEASCTLQGILWGFSTIRHVIFPSFFAKPNASKRRLASALCEALSRSSVVKSRSTPQGASSQRAEGRLATAYQERT